MSGAHGSKSRVAALVKKELMKTAGAKDEVKHEPPEEQPAGPSLSSEPSTSRARAGSPQDTEKKKFICDNCGRMFDLRTTLIQHLQDHQHQPYMCHICERLFVKLANLCNHRQVHFRCQVCQKQFNQKGNRPLPYVPPIGSYFRGAS